MITYRGYLRGVSTPTGSAHKIGVGISEMIGRKEAHFYKDNINLKIKRICTF